MRGTAEADGEQPGAAPLGRVQSVDRALKLLEAVAASAPDGATVAVLAGRCKLNRATAWRLLGTLEANGMVERDPVTSRYQLGLTLIRFASAAGHEGLVRRTRPILERVSNQTGETADLAVAGAHGVTYVGEVTPSSVLAISWLSQEVPLHATSTGKALLSWLPRSEALSMLELPLEGFTATTITDPDELAAELERTRSQGFAECAGELEQTLYGVSAPILNPTNDRPIAVFSIWGPVTRVPASRFPELGPIAMEAAAQVQSALRD